MCEVRAGHVQSGKMSPIHIAAKHGSVEVLELMWTWCGVMREDHLYQPFEEQDGVSAWTGRESEGEGGGEGEREGGGERGTGGGGTGGGEGEGEDDWSDHTLTTHCRTSINFHGAYIS